MFKSLPACAVIAILSLASLAPLTAQQKPVVVASVAPLEEMLADFDHLIELAPADELTQARAVIGLYAEGIDKTKHTIAIITLNPDNPREDPVLTAFLPVTNYDTVVERIGEQLNGLQDDGDGIKSIDTGEQQFYMKEHGSYLLVSSDKRSLDGQPADPAKYLNSFHKKYDVAAVALASNVPTALKQTLLKEFEQDIDESMLEQTAQSQASSDMEELAKKMAEQSKQQMQMMSDGLQNVGVGFIINREAGYSKFEMMVNATAGSELEKSFKQTQADTSFPMFLDDDAPLRMNYTVNYDPAESGMAYFIDAFKAGIAEGMRNAEQPNPAAPFVDDVVEMLQATAKMGKVDMGAVVLEDQGRPAVVVGGAIAKGGKLDGILRQVMGGIQQQPGEMGLKMDADKDGTTSIHEVVLGQDFVSLMIQGSIGANGGIAMGLGPDRMFAAVGSAPIANLKRVLSGKPDKTASRTMPFQFKARVAKLMQMGMQENMPPELAQAITQSGTNDQVLVELGVIPRGISFRIAVQDGVLRIAHEANKLMDAGAEGFEEGALPEFGN